MLTTGSYMSFSSFEDAMKYGKLISESSLCPAAYRGKPGDIVVAVQLGAEIGLKPLQAIQSICVINGKPSLYGDAMLALVRRSGLLGSIHETVRDDIAVCEIVRVGDKPRIFTFSMEQAKQAGLIGKPGPWKSYPDRMLMFRARGFGLRDCFGDVLGGLITAEEAMDYPTGIDIGAVVDEIVAIASTGIVPDDMIDDVMRRADIVHLRDIGMHPKKATDLLAYWKRKYSEQLKEMDNGKL